MSEIRNMIAEAIRDYFSDNTVADEMTPNPLLLSQRYALTDAILARMTANQFYVVGGGAKANRPKPPNDEANPSREGDCVIECGAPGCSSWGCLK